MLYSMKKKWFTSLKRPDTSKVIKLLTYNLRWSHQLRKKVDNTTESDEINENASEQKTLQDHTSAQVQAHNYQLTEDNT